MTRPKTHRQLAFERLEAKSAPSSMLLLLAVESAETSLSDEVLKEHQLEATATVEVTGSKWEFEHSPQMLMEFIVTHTSPCPEEIMSWATPSQADCDDADEMMKLEDSELRALVLAEPFSVE